MGTYWARTSGGPLARRREKRAFGSIRRLSSGNYQARYLAQSGERVTAPMTFLTRMDAEAWLLAERRIVQDGGSWHSPKERTAEERLQEELEVSRAVVRARTTDPAAARLIEELVGPPKTDAGVRSVSIPGFLIPSIEDHLDRHAAPGPVGLLFHASQDETKHLPETTMNGRAAVLNDDGSIRKAGFGWRQARRRAGREDLGLHDLRHTGATWAAEKGASIAELMSRLGHSIPSMAIHYQHSRQERDREISRRLSRRNGLRAV